MSTDTLDAYRGSTLETAELIAPTWERRRADVEAVAAPVREWVVRELAPRPGDTVLDLAAGVGDTGFAAAALVGARGRLICSDLSPAMLAAARRRGAELGVENVDYRVLDAERIDIADDAVDGVLCRFGYMLMADPAAALAETRRVLRPGGRLALAVWGAPERNPFFTAAVMALLERGKVEPPQPGLPGPFALADEERLTALLVASGFRDVRTAWVQVRFAVRDVDDYLEFITDTAGAIALTLRSLADDDRAAVRSWCEAALRPWATGRGYAVPGLALCATAR